MEKKVILQIVFIFIIGIAITVASGLINTTPPSLMGTTWYGFPLAWRYVPVIPNPIENYNIGLFILDFLLWSFITFISIVLIKKIKS